MTPDMAESARANLRRSGVAGAEVQVSSAESVPYPDASFEVVISNGVFNLSLVKEEVFKEYRVLRRGGRLQFCGHCGEPDLASRGRQQPRGMVAVSGWRIPVRDQVELMGKAGFIQSEYLGTSSVTTFRFTVGALFRARQARSM